MMIVYVKRYKLRKLIERAEFPNEQSWLDMNNFMRICMKGKKIKSLGNMILNGMI